MRASLADQLEVEDLRRKFRKYAAGRVAPELPDFYKVSTDRRRSVMCICTRSHDEVGARMSPPSCREALLSWVIAEVKAVAAEAAGI